MATKIKTKIPELNFHSLDISEDFSSLEEMLDCFAEGCPGLDPRVNEAVLATVITVELDYPDYPLAEYLEKFQDNSDACARFAFTALHAEELASDDETEKRIKALIRQLSPSLGEPCDLFAGMPTFPEFGLDIARQAHVRNGVHRDEIWKRIPGRENGPFRY